MNPKAESARALLLDQKKRLEKVIREDAFPFTTASARRLLGIVQSWQRDMDRDPELWAPIALGFMGKNGWGPLIDATCSDSEHHKRINAQSGKAAA